MNNNRTPSPPTNRRKPYLAAVPKGRRQGFTIDSIHTPGGLLIESMRDSDVVDDYIRSHERYAGRNKGWLMLHSHQLFNDLVQDGIHHQSIYTWFSKQGWQNRLRDHIQNYYNREQSAHNILQNINNQFFNNSGQL